MKMPPQTLILVIEDNPVNLRLFSLILDKAGYRVHAVNNAEDGIKRVHDLRPSLVLMDMQLPGMDGLAATRMLKSDPTSRAIPVVAITAFAMKGDEERVRSAGCDGFITKPIRYREFLAEVARHLAIGESK